MVSELNKTQLKQFFNNPRIVLITIYALIILIINYMYLPSIVSSITNNIPEYYLVYTTILLGLATPLVLVNKGIIGKPRDAFRGLLTAGIIYSFIVILSWIAGVIGGRLGSSLGGVALITIYSLATGAFLAGIIATLVSRIRDPDIAAGIGGTILAAATAFIAILGKSGPLTIAAVAATNYGLGYVLTLEIKKRGLLSGSLMYGLLLALIIIGPISIGGRLLVGGLLIALGAIGGWYLTQFSLTPPENIHVSVGRPKSSSNIAVALVIIGVVVGGLAYLYHENVMFWKPYAIVTGSMEPAVQRGDIVLLEKVDFNKLRVGDVITYAKGSVPVTHRIYNMSSDGVIWTKGDANANVDPYKIYPDDVIGRVKYTIPKIGWALILLNWSPLIRYAILSISIAAITLIAYSSIPRADTEQEEK